MKIAVITIVSGRHEHLARQHAALAASAVKPSSYVVVSMDRSLADWAPSNAPRPTIVHLDADPTHLPLARARNAGAEHALADAADLLIFLDVDCLPTGSLISGYASAAARHPLSLLSGAVGYLPEAVDYSRDLDEQAEFHSFRPRLEATREAPAEARLFWSLSFAITAAAWRKIGGFHEGYSGYGAEDTDFAQLAETAGVELLWAGGCEAFHQYHPTQSPPVQHLNDILENGALFASRWGYWPMRGWLEEFQALGLVEWHPESSSWQFARVDA